MDFLFWLSSLWSKGDGVVRYGSQVSIDGVRLCSLDANHRYRYLHSSVVFGLGYENTPSIFGNAALISNRQGFAGCSHSCTPVEISSVILDGFVSAFKYISSCQRTGLGDCGRSAMMKSKRLSSWFQFNGMTSMTYKGRAHLLVILL